MKKNILLISCALLSILPLTSCSCDLFEKAGDIKDYVGTYTLVTAHEKTYHVYWNQKTLKSEKDLSDPPKQLTIHENKTVTYIDNEGNEKKGTVKCLEKYCRFYFLPVSSSYKFNLRNNKDLYYSYESFHMSVEYDVTYRTISYTRQ